jgi:hypothetical protein
VRRQHALVFAYVLVCVLVCVLATLAVSTPKAPNIGR